MDRGVIPVLRAERQHSMSCNIHYKKCIPFIILKKLTGQVVVNNKRQLTRFVAIH